MRAIKIFFHDLKKGRYKPDSTSFREIYFCSLCCLWDVGTGNRGSEIFSTDELLSAIKLLSSHKM